MRLNHKSDLKPRHKLVVEESEVKWTICFSFGLARRRTDLPDKGNEIIKNESDTFRTKKCIIYLIKGTYYPLN